jgi:hypothetical protein
MWPLAGNQAGSVDPPHAEGFSLAHSEVPADKIEAYLATEYRFGDGSDAITLRIDRRSDELARLYASSGAACGVFVTAFNPFGRVRSIADNEAAHLRLATDLEALSARVIEGGRRRPVGGVAGREAIFFARGRSRCRERLAKFVVQLGLASEVRVTLGWFPGDREARVLDIGTPARQPVSASHRAGRADPTLARSGECLFVDRFPSRQG